MRLLCEILCFVILAIVITQAKSVPSGPSFISPDIVHYLNSAGAECHIPKDSLDQILTSVGIARTPVGFAPQTLCYRPYPKSEDNVDTDTLGSFCALSFETLKALCKQQRNSKIQTVAVPPSNYLSVKEVCGILTQWILNTELPLVTRVQFGEHCNRTCSADVRPDGSAEVNKQCYDLYYGRVLLSRMGEGSNLQPPADGGGSNVLLQTSPSGPAASAAQRQTAAAEVTPTAAVTYPQLVDGEMMRNTLLEQYNLTQTGNNDTEPVEGAAVYPGLSSSKITSAEDPAAPPAQTASPLAPRPPPFSATGMSPGLLVPGSVQPKLPAFPSGPAGPATGPGDAPAAQTTNKVEGAPELAGNLTPLDASAAAGDKDVLSAAVSDSGAPPVLSGRGSPSPSPAATAAAATSSSRRPPARADEIPPPPPASAAGPVTSSTSSAPPAAGSPLVGDGPGSAGSAPAAPLAGDVDPGKLPVGQEIVGDEQDVDYEDPSARYETGQKDSLPAYEPEQKLPPAAARGADDFSLNEPRQLYKAPSGLQSMDDVPGVSPFKPLREQGGSESNFFAYFLTLVVLVVVVYIVFHNKKKIMALIIEGRQSSGRRRPHSSQYRKLDSSLEEAVTSQQRQQIASNIIY